MTAPSPNVSAEEALTDAIEAQNLYHGRHGTTPAGRTTALAILSCLRNHHGLGLGPDGRDDVEQALWDKWTAGEKLAYGVGYRRGRAALSSTEAGRLREALEYAAGFMADPEGLAHRREEWLAKVNAALESETGEPRHEECGHLWHDHGPHGCETSGCPCLTIIAVEP